MTASERRSRVVLLCILAPTLAIGLLGMFVDFFPSELLLGKAAIAACLAVTLVLVAILIVAWLRSGLLPSEEDTGVPIRRRVALATVVFSFVLGLVTLLAMIKGVPWAYTSLTGNNTHMIVAMTTAHRKARRECDYRAVGPMRNFKAAKVCISKEQFQAHPNQRVMVLISGRETALGFAVNRVELRSIAGSVH